jgi:hypothetical protein
MRVFGETLLVVRLFGDICVLIAAGATYFICRRNANPVESALAVLAMIAVTATDAFQPTMTEHVVIALVMVSVLLVVACRDSLWSAFCVGLLMSLATITRLNIALLVVALGAYYAWGLIWGSPAAPSFRDCHLCSRRARAVADVAGGLLVRWGTERAVPMQRVGSVIVLPEPDDGTQGFDGARTIVAPRIGSRSRNLSAFYGTDFLGGHQVLYVLPPKAVGKHSHHSGCGTARSASDRFFSLWGNAPIGADGWGRILALLASTPAVCGDIYGGRRL